MRSMTGFGLGEAPLADGRLLLEARSLNHRFLELRVTLPPELASQSAYLEQLARERLRRGRYALAVRLVGISAASPRLDLARARGALRALIELRDELAPGTELPLAALASLPGLFDASLAVDDAVTRGALREAFERAIAALDIMRAAEGSALDRSLRAQLGEARATCAAIAERSPLLVGLYRRRLRDRVELLGRESGLEIDAGRLEAEVVLLAERSDVSEELARLGSHFDQLGALLAGEEPVGRTIEFLLQEMARETNTIGSKSQDALLAQRVVDLKGWLERMREQIQNVE
jgi:uncharacterized protein (TIGR00255 family)